MAGARQAGPRRGRAAAWALAMLAVAALSAAGCAHQMSAGRIAPGTSPSPSVPWSPPPEAAAESGAPPSATAKESSGSGAPAGAPVIPPDLLASARNWTLDDLLDLALRSAPQTRITWARARSAAAELGARKGDYYPTALGQVNAARVKGSAVGGQFTYYSTSYDPFVQLNWLLLDFGGRKATVDSARQALIAADWTHNASIQDVVLLVEQAYYDYLDARAIEAAERSAVAEAEASLDAAERRRASGVSTVADVLQAKTRLSQARLALETVEGRIQVIHGSLATAMGLPANTPFDVNLPMGEVPEQEAAVEVERAIAEAQALRPDLAAARAEVAKAEADLRSRQAANRPTLNFSTNSGRIYYDALVTHQDTYTSSLLLTIPIFNGLTYQYNVHKASADRDEAQARLDTLQQAVTLQVWTGYYGHKTAAQQVKTAGDLLESARQSYEVAAARYKAGVGNILDLLTAQSALEQARAQQTQARTAWFQTLAQLAHDTGTLWHSAPGGAPDTRKDETP